MRLQGAGGRRYGRRGSEQGSEFCQLTLQILWPLTPCLRIYAKEILNREKAGCTRMCVPAANGSHSMDAALRDPHHFLGPVTMLSQLPFPHLMMTAPLPPRRLRG